MCDIDFELRAYEIAKEISKQPNAQDFLDEKNKLFMENPNHVDILLKLDDILGEYNNLIIKQVYINGIKDGMAISRVNQKSRGRPP